MGGHHNSANLLDGLGSLGVSAETGTQLVGVESGSSRWRPRCSWKPQLLTLCLEPVSWPWPFQISGPWISRIYHQTELLNHTHFISLFYTLDIYIYIWRFPKMVVPPNHPFFTADFPWNSHHPALGAPGAPLDISCFVISRFTAPKPSRRRAHLPTYWDEALDHLWPGDMMGIWYLGHTYNNLLMILWYPKYHTYNLLLSCYYCQIYYNTVTILITILITIIMIIIW